MQKNVVLCSDGTGNTTIKDRGTNVFKLFEAVDLQTRPDITDFVPQIAFYDDGVGTERLKLLKVVGGAFGYGLGRNICDLYGELVRVYEPGDRLFLFGFSRGAYTVRALAGLIAHVGIVDRSKARTDAELDRLVKRAYGEFRRCFRRVFSTPDQFDSQRADEFRRQHSIAHPSFIDGFKPPIQFIGVWDTVDALGFPIDEIADFWNAFVYPFKFPDRNLSPTVARACHAVAIDDERYTFHPVMWNHDAKDPDRIQQVWFAGAHSNVGGGYPKQGLSLVSLCWMIQEAEKAGLRFLPSVRDLFFELQNGNDKLYDSRAGIGAYYRYKPRNIATICAQHGTPARIHVSIFQRLALGTQAYAPGNLPIDFQIVADPHMQPIATRLASYVGQIAARQRPLLHQTAPWIWARRAAHYSFVIFSLVLLGAALAGIGNIDGNNLRSLPGSATEVRKLGSALASLTELDGWTKAFGVLALKWWLLLPLVLTYLISSVSTRKAQQTYSQFWFSMRPSLRRLLLGEDFASTAGARAASASDSAHPAR